MEYRMPTTPAKLVIIGSGPAGSPGDYEATVSRHGILVIPTVVAPDGRRVIGDVSLSEYELSSESDDT